MIGFWKVDVSKRNENQVGDLQFDISVTLVIELKRGEQMATDKNRIMISLDDKNLEKLENLIEDARDRRGMRLTKSQIIELLLNTVDYFDDIMGAIYSKK